MSFSIKFNKFIVHIVYGINQIKDSFGKIKLKLHNKLIASSKLVEYLYINKIKTHFKVTNMWYNHLKTEVIKKTELSDLDNILGKKDDDDAHGDSIGIFCLCLTLKF